MKRPLSILIPLALFCVGCAKFPQDVPLGPQPEARGSLYKVERVDARNVFELKMLLRLAGLPEPAHVWRGIDMYRVQYRTVLPGGAPTVASGLVAMPRSGDPVAVVSYFHGTNPVRAAAPSAPTLYEGVLGSAIFAGAGYLFVAPDYIGLGTSQGLHPYMYAQSTADVSIDLLIAAHNLSGQMGRKWPSALYLTGFSQGGHSTFAVQRELERMADPRFNVKASAPVAGPFDLAGITFPTMLKSHGAPFSFYLGYIVTAYSNIYGKPIDSVMEEKYAADLPPLLDGNHYHEQIYAILPENPRDLFSKAFLDDYDNARSNWFTDALEANSVSEWTPKAPVKIFYGDADKDVSPDEAKSAADSMTKAGCDVTAISVGPYTHEISILHAIPKVRAWFDELTKL